MAQINFPDSPTEGQRWTDANGVGWKFENGIWQRAISGRKITLGELSDVSTSSPSVGQGLRYNGSQFVPDTFNPSYPSDNKNFPDNRQAFIVSFPSFLVGPDVYKKVPCDKIYQDPNGNFNTTLNRFVVPTGYSGLYRFIGKFGHHTEDPIEFEIRKNGVYAGRIGQATNYDGVGARICTEIRGGFVIVECNAGDYIELYAHNPQASNSEVYGYKWNHTSTTIDATNDYIRNATYYLNHFRWNGTKINVSGFTTNNGTFTVTVDNTVEDDVLAQIDLVENILFSEGSPDVTIEYHDDTPSPYYFAGYLERAY